MRIRRWRASEDPSPVTSPPLGSSRHGVTTPSFTESSRAPRRLPNGGAARSTRAQARTRRNRHGHPLYRSFTPRRRRLDSHDRVGSIAKSPTDTSRKANAARFLHAAYGAGQTSRADLTKGGRPSIAHRRVNDGERRITQRGCCSHLYGMRGSGSEGAFDAVGIARQPSRHRRDRGPPAQVRHLANGRSGCRLYARWPKGARARRIREGHKSRWRR